MNILIAACCPGSAESIVSVVKILASEGNDVKVIGVDNKGEQKGSFCGSASIFKAQNIAFSELESIVKTDSFSNIPDEAIARLIKEYNPKCILVGSSRDLTGIFRGIEEGLIINGRGLGIPVIQFVDGWEVWYPRKFSGYVADAYLVPDIITRKILRVRGNIQPNKIYITGNPAWESFVTTKKIDRDGIRRQYGLSSKDRLFVYFGAVTPDDPTTLRWVLKNLSFSGRLIFRKHPRDRRSYEQIICEYREMMIFTDLDSDTVLQCADVCLTHHGAMGVKAALAGITTINFILSGDCDQLCRECGGFPLSVLGGSYQVKDESQYRDTIKKANPPDAEEIKRKLCIDGRASERIVNVLKSVALGTDTIKIKR